MKQSHFWTKSLRIWIKYLFQMHKFSPHNHKQLFSISAPNYISRAEELIFVYNRFRKSFIFHFPPASKWSVNRKAGLLTTQDSKQITNLFKYTICLYKNFTTHLLVEIKQETRHLLQLKLVLAVTLARQIHRLLDKHWCVAFILEIHSINFHPKVVIKLFVHTIISLILSDYLKL